MALYILIGLAVASLVFAFFSARTWHWGYVVVVELIFLAMFGFLLLAAQIVKMNAPLRTLAEQKRKELEIVLAQNDALLNGTTNVEILRPLINQDPPLKVPENADSVPSIAALDHELLIATRHRGRVWRDAKPLSPPNPQTGALTVSVPLPKPAGIRPETVVYLFEDPQPPVPKTAPGGPQYLGEFRVAQAGPQQVALVPVLPLDTFERNRLAASRVAWTVYETMPADRHDIFAVKTDQERQALKQKLPKQSVNEYLRDNTPATADDDPIRVTTYDENGKPLKPAEIAAAKNVKKLYQRRLREYAAEFDELARRRIVMFTERDAVLRDNARLEAAVDVAKKERAFREEERQKLTMDLAGINKERQAIEHHLAVVNQELTRARQLTEELLQQNNRMAAELAARQSKPRPPGSGATSPAKPAPLALERR